MKRQQRDNSGPHRVNSTSSALKPHRPLISIQIVESQFTQVMSTMCYSAGVGCRGSLREDFLLSCESLDQPGSFNTTSNPLSTFFNSPLTHFQATFKPPSSHLQATFKPPSSHLQATFKPPSSHLQATFKPPSSHLQATFKPPSSHLQATFKPPSSHLQATFKPLSSHLQATFNPPSSHLQATFKPPSSHLQPTFKPLSSLQTTSSALQTTLSYKLCFINHTSTLTRPRYGLAGKG